MKSNPLLPLLHHESFTLALVRICCRVVELDYRKHPDLYRTYPPTRIAALAELHRSTFGFPGLHGTFLYIAKAVAVGYKLRDIPCHMPEQVWRSISKKRPGLRRS